MKLVKEILNSLKKIIDSNQFTVKIYEVAEDGMALCLKGESLDMVEYQVIASWGGGWDHVSVSLGNTRKDECPTWDEMCWIKGIFWHECESVIQYHPAKNEYVNCYEFCLHLWKPQNTVLPTPPMEFVGIKNG